MSPALGRSGSTSSLFVRQCALGLNDASHDAQQPVDVSFQLFDSLGNRGKRPRTDAAGAGRRRFALRAGRGGLALRAERRLDSDVCTHLACHFGSRSGDIGTANRMLFAQIRCQEHPIAQGIDLARHTAGGPMDGDEGIGFELRITFPADMAKPVFDYARVSA